VALIDKAERFYQRIFINAVDTVAWQRDGFEMKTSSWLHTVAAAGVVACQQRSSLLVIRLAI